MDPRTVDWWRRHGWTIALLLTAFGLALLIRTVWTVPILQMFGTLNVYGGGSDSYYHSRVMAYIALNHQNLIHDALLRYPVGYTNPREPLFDWMNAVLGIVFAGAWGGNAVTAGSFFLSIQGPVWAALSVFPIYLIGKEVRDRRVGLVAALLFPFLVASIESSTLGYANYLSFYTFFMLVTVYSYLRTIKAVGSHRWVESYRNYRTIPDAVRAFLRTERTAVKWAVFTGVSFGALALAWQGYSLVVAVFIGFIAVALIVERLRRVDSFGLYVATWIVGLVGFPIAVPYYLVQGEFAGWFDIPLLVFFGGLLIFLPFMYLRDYPWVVSIPVLAATAGVAVLILYLTNPTFLTTIVTGQGYFVKTLVYSTVAEAQAPSIDQLVIGYGVVTFFIAFVGLGLLVWALIRHRWPRVILAFLVFAIISIYLPLSAAKFFYLGSAVFAILPAEALVRALDVAGFPQLRRNITALSDSRGKLTAFRRSFKIRQALILLLVVGILVPNVWYAVDAGVPLNSKTQFGEQIQNTLPSFLRSSLPNASSTYLGAAGVDLDTPNQYDSAGYNWLALQDQNLPAPERPAFVSWWDYGFQAVAQGQHPTVADNFQNGIEPSGNFLLSQNQSIAIGTLAATLLSSELKVTGSQYLPSGLGALLTRDGVNVSRLNGYLVNQSEDLEMVLANPDRYLPMDPTTLTALNAMYLVVSYYLADIQTEQGVAQIYNDIQSYTGWSIRYAMVDTRLFPFSASNTGIFYAPAELTGRVIGPDGVPTSYFTITQQGSDGNTYQVGQTLPPGVTLVGNATINYLSPFFNSMIYRIFVGYNATDIGQSGVGIPGLLGSVAQGYGAEPGWMLSHFLVVYRTAYYCAGTTPTKDPNCLMAANLPEAAHIANVTNGYSDLSTDSFYAAGEAMLAYYPGQFVTGSVTLPNGQPVSGARVTVYDSWNIPHQTTVTGPTGAYSVVLPPGNDTVNITTGAFNGLIQAGDTVLSSIHVVVPNAVGFSLNAPALVRNVVLNPAHVFGKVYWNTANNTTYQPTDPVLPGANVTLSEPNGTTLHGVTDAAGDFDFPTVPPGLYNMTVGVSGHEYPQTSVTASVGAQVNRSVGLAPGEVLGLVRTPTGTGIPDALVVVQNPQGATVALTSSGAGGAYSIPTLGPGNYTVAAHAEAESLTSNATGFSITNTTTQASINLTVVPASHFSMRVTASSGGSTAGFPIRFTALPDTGGPGGAPSPQAGYTFTTGPNGIVEGILPEGSYSVYGFGPVGASFYAGSGARSIVSGSGTLALAGLAVVPAEELRGTVTAPANSSVTLSHVAVTAYDASGNPVTAFANTTGGYVLYLPPGPYSVLATYGASNATNYAAMGFVNSLPQSNLPLVLDTAATFHPTVGSKNAKGVFVPAPGAVVTVTPSTPSAVFTAPANASGVVNLILPDTLPGLGSYCINGAALGYSPYSRCAVSPSLIGSVTQVPLTLNTVTAAVTLTGLPAGAMFTLNLTAASPTAENLSLKALSPVGVTVYPGLYAVTGYAPVAGYPGFFMPLNGTMLNVPFGAVNPSLNVTVLDQVRAHGTLVLPSGLSASSVTVNLTAAVASLSVNGTAFTSHFYAPPTAYTAFASAREANVSYTGLTALTIPTGGGIVTPVALTSDAVDTLVTFKSPEGTALSGSFPFTVTAPGPLTLPARTVAGEAALILPGNATYSFALNTTRLVTLNGTNEVRTYTVEPGYTCRPIGPTANCSVPLAAQPHPATVNGTFVLSGAPLFMAGSVRFEGPAPSTAVTTVRVSSGTFATSLIPGVYSVYTTAGIGTGQLANLTTFHVDALSNNSLAIVLGSAWTGMVTVNPSATPVLSPTTLRITSPLGVGLTFPGVSLGNPSTLLLPPGVYTATANATTAPYGRTTPANATGTLALVQGNGALALALSPRFLYSASVAVQSPTSASLPAIGGVATFTWLVRNTGTAPETVRLSGGPTYVGFQFSPTSVTLAVTGPTSSAGGTVRVSVPGGLHTTTVPINVAALFANGTAAGTSSPSGTVLLSPLPGVGLGPGSVATTVSASTANVTFYLLNTGNVPQELDVYVSNAGRLAGLGWSTALYQGSGVLTNPVPVAPGANLSLVVRLSAMIPMPAPPQFVTISAFSAAGGTAPVQASTILEVPITPIQVNGTQSNVTGPSIGSPSSTPTWLVPVLSFVPALAFLGAAFTWRWYRTRRWVR